MALIEIDGLPIQNGDFPWRTVSHNQMVLGFAEDDGIYFLHGKSTTWGIDAGILFIFLVVP